MFTEAPFQKFEFPWPNEEKGYQLFPTELEADPLVLFHGTLKQNLQSILKEGFKARPPLESVSYAKSSVYCLTHLFTGRQSLSEEAVVIAVRFETLTQQGVQENHSDVHVYKPEIQPIVLGYCEIPMAYAHK